MPSYLRLNARMYAQKWALARNPDYPDYSSANGGGGDCANFVSQCLHAGGWPMTLVGDNQWWSVAKISNPTWHSAERLRRFTRCNLLRLPCGWNDLAPGELVFVVPRSLGSDRAAHVMIVSEVKALSHINPTYKNEVFLCGHSNDRLNMPLKDVASNSGGEGNLEFRKIDNRCIG